MLTISKRQSIAGGREEQRKFAVNLATFKRRKMANEKTPLLVTRKDEVVVTIAREKLELDLDDFDENK